MAKFRTTYGRFIDEAGPDPLEGLLADADEAATRRRRHSRTLGPAPKKSALMCGARRLGGHVATSLARMGCPSKWWTAT